MRDDCPWGANGFRLKKVPYSTNRLPENEKKLTILAPILLTTSFFWYLNNFISISWFSGYSVMTRILRTDVLRSNNSICIGLAKSLDSMIFPLMYYDRKGREPNVIKVSASPVLVRQTDLEALHTNLINKTGFQF